MAEEPAGPGELGTGERSRTSQNIVERSQVKSRSLNISTWCNIPVAHTLIVLFYIQQVNRVQQK